MTPTRRSTLQLLAGALALPSTAAADAAGGDAGMGLNGAHLLTGHRPLCTLNAYPNFTHTTSVAPAPQEALQAVQLILDAVGIEQNIEVLVGDFSAKVGGFATIRQDTRFIVYDGAEFTFAGGRTDWVALGLLGHEIGHHLAAHVYTSGRTSQEDELEADRFAGVALSRLGASLEQALAWTADLSVSGGTTHPPRSQRIAAVRAGWHQGEGLKHREQEPCAPAWLGDPFPFEGRQCRIARTCPNREEHIRLACEAYDRSWQWVSGAKK